MLPRNARITLLLSLLLPVLLNGCATAVVGGAATGAAVVHDRRSTGTVIDDQEIEIKAIKLAYDNPDIRQRSNISVTSYNLVALLTGQAETAEVAQRFAELVANLPRVRRVHNEVVIGAERSLTEETQDIYLTSRAKVALFDVKQEGFDPTRVKVVTSQSVVYLMGLVTHAEAEAASDKVRYISGVKRVVKVFEYLD